MKRLLFLSLVALIVVNTNALVLYDADGARVYVRDGAYAYYPETVPGAVARDAVYGTAGVVDGTLRAFGL